MYPSPAHGKGKLRASVWDITSKAEAPSPLSVLSVSKPTSVGSAAASATCADHKPTSDQERPLFAPTGNIDPASSAVQSPASSLCPPNIPVSQASPTSFFLPTGILPNSVDVITVIYVLSALHPLEWEQAIHNLYTVSNSSHQPISPLT